MLNNPLKVLMPKMDNAIDRRRPALYSVHQPAYICASASPWFLPIVVCSPMQSLPLYRSGFIGVDETSMPCTKGFVFVQVRLCPVSVFAKFMCTSNKCSE